MMTVDKTFDLTGGVYLYNMIQSICFGVGCERFETKCLIIELTKYGVVCGTEFSSELPHIRNIYIYVLVWGTSLS